MSSETRGHNGINELEERDTDPGSSGGELALSYDHNGNITAQDLTASIAQTCVHDAWNRLVAVDVDSDPRMRFQYNGLHWRIVRQADTDASGALDQQRILYHGSDWTLVQEAIYDGWTSSTPGSIDRVIEHFWSPVTGQMALYRLDANADGDFIDSTDRTARTLTDSLGSPIAFLLSDGTLIHRISYDAYGRALSQRQGDLDGDGDTDGTDQGILLNAWNTGGSPHTADLTRDGNVDAVDLGLLQTHWGQAAPPDDLNLYRGSLDLTIGYAGYAWNFEFKTYSVGYRHYDPLLGRWLQRDPAGYVDGMSLYGYVRGDPMGAADPLGLMRPFQSMGLAGDPSAPFSQPNAANVFDAWFEAFFGEFWDRTAGRACDTIQGAGTLAKEVGLNAGFAVGALDYDTLHANSAFEQAVFEREIANPDGELAGALPQNDRQVKEFTCISMNACAPKKS